MRFDLNGYDGPYAKVTLGRDVTIGMVAYGNVETTKLALDHLFVSAQGDFEIILIDDCSPDNGQIRSLFQEVAAYHANTRVFSFTSNLEYSGSLNAILSHATGNKILFLSNDIFVTPAYLAELFEVIDKNPKLGLLRGVSNFVDNDLPTHNLSHRPLQEPDDLFRWAEEIRLADKDQIMVDSYLTGDAFLVTRAVVNKIGTLDPLFFGYFADHDFGVRAKIAGFELGLARGALAYHKRAANFDYLPDDLREQKSIRRLGRVFENWARFKLKYGLPVDLMYTSVNNIAWTELDAAKFDSARHFCTPGDYSAFEVDRERGF